MIMRRAVEERVSEHAQGLDVTCYTFNRRPATLVHSEHYARIVVFALPAFNVALFLARGARLPHAPLTPSAIAIHVAP